MRRLVVTLTLIFSLISALDSLAQTQPSPPANPEEKATDQQIEAALDEKLVKITGDLANYTLWLVLVTGALAIVTVGFVFLARRQNKISEVQNEITKVTSRAYLSVEPQGIDRWQSQNNQILGHVGVRNAGHLPALDVTWTLHIEFDNDGKREKYSIRDTVRNGPVITPGMVMRRGTANIPSTTALFCYVWGRIRYNDGFGVQRKTEFCHRYNCKISSFVKVQRISARHARYHEFGNDAD